MKKWIVLLIIVTFGLGFFAGYAYKEHEVNKIGTWLHYAKMPTLTMGEPIGITVIPVEGDEGFVMAYKYWDGENDVWCNDVAQINNGFSDAIARGDNMYLVIGFFGNEQ